MYEKEKKKQLDNENISRIISDFQKKIISSEQAKSQLYPLVKNSLEERLKSVDSDIQRTEKKLEYLRKVKQDPSIMVKNQISQLLGEAGQMPSPDILGP